MKTLNDVIAEVEAQIASLQTTLADLQALAAAPAPTGTVSEVDVVSDQGTEKFVPETDQAAQ